MIPIPDLYSVVQIFVVSQDSPSVTILRWDLLNYVAETLKEIVTSSTCIQEVIRKISIFFQLTDTLSCIVPCLNCSIGLVIKILAYCARCSLCGVSRAALKLNWVSSFIQDIHNDIGTIGAQYW